MSPPSYGCNVPVIPTFISTDLITPGHENRETLPAIGLHTRDLQRPKLWGHETKPIAYGELAYSCFKPSHLCTDHMIVTHRHHGNRISYIEPKEQPYHITSLQLSKCRMNDQLMPPPLESNLPQKHFVEEPWPYDLRNNYFSHRCKFQLFPTNGVDLRDAAVPQEKQLIRLFQNTEIKSHIKEMSSTEIRYLKKPPPEITVSDDAETLTMYWNQFTTLIIWILQYHAIRCTNDTNITRNYPDWPWDFRFDMTGYRGNDKCVLLKEAMPLHHYWFDNLFCVKQGPEYIDIGMEWSSKGKIANKTCVNINEPFSYWAWYDNHLCFNKDIPYDFQWSYFGCVANKACILWFEPMSPYGETWWDDYLCATNTVPEKTYYCSGNLLKGCLLTKILVMLFHLHMNFL